MPTRVIIDTNLWVSHLMSGRHVQLKELLSNENVQILYSSSLLNEFLNVVERPKFRRYFSFEDGLELADILKSVGQKIEVTSQLSACRDPKDNFLLALAKDGRANFLITGDADLLVLNPFEGVEIVNWASFSARI